MIPVYILTSNKYIKCLPPFAYLFNKFWSPEQKVTVACYEETPQKLPDNFEVVSLGKQENYSWSDGLLKFLELMDDPIFLFSLEDYFLDRRVKVNTINELYNYLENKEEVKKIDLTNDRLKTPYGPWESWGKIQFVRSSNDALYQMSVAAALWKREYMLEFTKPGENPWEFEKRGSRRVIKAHQEKEFHILGTKEHPFHYINAIGGQGRNTHKWDRKKFPNWLWGELQSKGLLW